MQAGDADRMQQLERALAEARARLDTQDAARLLVQSCPDIVVLMRLDGTILEANEAALKMLDLPRSALLGRSAFDLFPPQVAEGRRAMAAEVARSGASLRAVDVVDGRVIDNILVPLRDDQGVVDHLAIYARDITQRFQAERRAHADEGRRAENPTPRPLDAMTGDVAHEFNNLLTPILGYLRIAQKHGASLAAGQQGLLDVALHSAEHAAALVAGTVGGGQPQATRGAAREPAQPPPATNPLHVLAVDDEDGVLQVVEVALQMAGHQVHCVGSAADGWRAFDGSPQAFDAAILDQNLGDGTGVELAQRLRARSSELRIVLISGRPSSALRRAAEVLDLRLLPKPFSVESLQGALTRD